MKLRKLHPFEGESGKTTFRRWFASNGQFAPEGYKPPHWFVCWQISKAINVPPWVIETDLPIHWRSRIEACMEAEALAHEWQEQKTKHRKR